MKEIKVTKDELVIPPSLVKLRELWGLSDFVPESQMLRWIMLELPPRDWYKLTFDSSVHDNNVGVGFVMQNDIGALVEDGSFPVVILSVLKQRLGAYERLYVGFSYDLWLKDYVGR